MRRSPTFLIALSLAVLVSAAGCSNLPTQPTAPGASGASALTHDESSELLGLESLLGSSSQTTTTKRIGILGGVVAAGNFKVVIPPGALLTTATITVSQPDPARPVVDLSIFPASANNFLLPVLLVADASPMEQSLLSVARIGYWNPKTGAWEGVSGSVVSVATLSVSAPLWHFSTYRVESGGKAGW
jgi:hypothetical protein